MRNHITHKVLRRWTLACCLSAALIGLGRSPTQAEESRLIGKPVELFSLPDYYGQSRAFDELVGDQVAVVAFLGVECPLAKLYGPRLQQLAEEYAGKGVVFIGIDANEQDSLTKIAAFARQSGIKFPILKDRGQEIADRFGVERNPIVYVLDRQRTIRYHGRIDDQYGLGSSSGYARPQINRRDLGVALDELLAGKEVSEPITSATGCLIGRKPKIEPTGDITYTRHIAGLMQNHCVACHRDGEIGPFALDNYDDVVSWSDMIREVVAEGRMPPWSASPEVGHFVNDPRLSDEQKEQLNTWIKNGCPEGDPQDLPEPRQWVDGWQIGEPDQIIRMPKPHKVPAEGVLNYEYIFAETGWKEDKWIQAAEVRPGNRAVVHHILTFVVSPLSRWKEPMGAGGPAPLTSYVPGSPPHAYEEGMAVFVPAGSRILFEIHYTPAGVEQEDQSYLGVVFADPDKVKRRVYYLGAETRTFTIPARASNHPVHSEYEFTSDQLLLSMSPHMHLRGKAFRYEAHYPNGDIEHLLEVPKYDFNWQLRYELAEPKLMPAGTKLKCVGWFDNSADNLANPDPDATLKFGWQTWDEMMNGFFISADAEELPAKTAAAPASEGK